MNAIRLGTTCAAIALASGHAAAQGGDVPITVLSSAVFDVPAGPLVPPSSTDQINAYVGTGLSIDNDGNWFGAFAFAIDNFNDTLQIARDVAFLRNGLPFSREGFELPGSPEWVPQAEEGTRASGGTPYRTARIAADGTVGQRLGGVTGFSLLPDGTPDPGTLIPFATLDTFQLAVIDNSVLMVEGERFEPISTIFDSPDTPAPGFDTGTGAIVEDIALVWPVSATEAYISARFEEGGGGTFGDSASALLRVTGIGTPMQDAEIIWVDGSGFVFDGLGGIELDSSEDFNEGFEAAPGGSFVTTIDIDGLPTAQADAVVLFDAAADAFSIVAQAGQPSPLGAGRLYQFLDSAVAINAAGDVAFVADDNGTSADDTAIIVNGAVIAREGDTVGTAVPGLLQDLTDQFGGRNLELDREGNVIWPGVWSVAGFCPDNTDSGFGIFNAIFFNDTPIIESGVTELENVTIGDQFFERLVVFSVGNSEAGSFTVSPDGDRLIAAVTVAEPSEDICTFSVNADTPVATLILEVDLAALRGDAGVPCNPADIDASGGLSFADVTAFVDAFNAGSDAADVNGDGLINFGDAIDFVTAFNEGCP